MCVIGGKRGTMEPSAGTEKGTVVGKPLQRRHDTRGALVMRTIERSEIPPNVFPQSAIGRCVLGLLSLAFIPFSAIFLYACTFEHPGPGWGVWLIRIALQEFFFALLAVSTCGLVWAVAAPAWLPTRAYRWVFRLTLLALIPFLIITGMMLWPV
jgi:hypothetical protein